MFSSIINHSTRKKAWKDTIVVTSALSVLKRLKLIIVVFVYLCFFNQCHKQQKSIPYSFSSHGIKIKGDSRPRGLTTCFPEEGWFHWSTFSRSSLSIFKSDLTHFSAPNPHLPSPWKVEY